MTLKSKILLFCVVVLVTFLAGGLLFTYTIAGLILLLGFVVLVESIPPLKWLVVRSTKLFDIIIFVAGILATINLGVTLSISLMIAGLAYTMVYAPILRHNHRRDVEQAKRFDKFK